MKDLKTPVVWHSGKKSIAQIYSCGLEYSFISNDFKQQSPWVYCKDFLQDALQGKIHKKKISIYGFSYDPKTDPEPSTTRMRLLVTNKSDNDFGNKIEHSLDFIHQLEEDVKTPSKTHVYRIPDVPGPYKKCGVYMFSGSSHWLLAPPMVSLYSLAIRIGFSHTKGKPYWETIDGVANGTIPGYQDNDKKQTKDAKSGIKRIIEVGYKNIFGKKMSQNYPKNADTHSMHNYFGICAFSTPSQQGSMKSYNPTWFEEKKKAQ